MLILLSIWLWLNCSGALWAYLTDGGKWAPSMWEWVMILLAPITITISTLFLLLNKLSKN